MAEQRKRRAKPATVTEVNSMARAPGRHSVGESLILCVSPSGARSWIARVRDGEGKRRDMGLGPFADLTLAEAREKARALRKAGRDGMPILTRAERRRAIRKVPTFKEAAEIVHAERKVVWSNGKHVDQWKNTLETYAYPKLGHLPVDKIGVNQVVEAVADVWQKRPETARRVRQRIMAILDWAHAREYRDTQVSNGAVGLGLGPQRGSKGNFAALPYIEVADLVRRIRSNETIGNLALEFAILAAARSGEVRGATWDEIDLTARLWIIPADRMKAGKEHVVPLSDRSLAIVQRAKELRTSDIVFPGRKGDAMSDATMAKALRDAGISRESGTVHGMRSAFRDWVSEETSFPSDVAEAALAHVIKNKVEAAYRRGSLLAKRREMMAAWANYCEGGSNVVRMVVG
ncbi:tyrosine-type recombinase/integrase [Sphingobium sp. AS12]|uniref:tyrosine-type recombinase/integrase n=1 Tax=Sphingobium sp. AS12 TaxID=2849495 RepID=UPI001C3144B8|nr:tyrosine-type recombinase/integrase [Sphingobium sp. AS12]MBV2147447.1 tyrosine-type recombinase/integrase [Sphingobium sp. AS12]